jgi:hypothetical protein
LPCAKWATALKTSIEFNCSRCVSASTTSAAGPLGQLDPLAPRSTVTRSRSCRSVTAAMLREGTVSEGWRAERPLPDAPVSVVAGGGHTANIMATSLPRRLAGASGHDIAGRKLLVDRILGGLKKRPRSHERRPAGGSVRTR